MTQNRFKRFSGRRTGVGKPIRPVDGGRGWWLDGCRRVGDILRRTVAFTERPKCFRSVRLCLSVSRRVVRLSRACALSSSFDSRLVSLVFLFSDRTTNAPQCPKEVSFIFFFRFFTKTFRTFPTTEERVLCVRDVFVASTPVVFLAVDARTRPADGRYVVTKCKYLFLN